MKLFLIKIGKALSALQKDGIIKGGKRILKSFFVMFRRVKAGDILFITGGVGDSALFRTLHFSEELEENGFQCSVTVQDNPFLATYADKFKIFIFHRVLYTPVVKKLIGKIKEQKKEIIFETDDLVFDPKYLEFMDYFKQMNSFEKKLYENGVGGEILEDPYVTTCTTTTEYLAEKLKEYNKNVFVVSNKLSKKDLGIAEKILKLEIPKKNKTVKLGYFSGTASHNKDFATIADALVVILEKYPQVELLLAGPLDLDSRFDKFKARISAPSYVAREKHFENNVKVDINLAPLEIGNPFCESKSELKFFEAGIVKTPTIASATGTFKKAIIDGVDGFVANITKEWIDKLEKLILNPELRSKLGTEARKKVLDKYTTKSTKDQKFYMYLRSKLL